MTTPRTGSLLESLATGALALLAAGTLLSSGASAAQAAGPESTVCLDCHDDRLQSLRGGPHQLDAGADDAETRISCTDCHLGDARHWNDDPETFPFTNPATAGAEATAKLCAGCHFTAHQQTAPEGNPHSLNGVGCTDCHQVHGAAHTASLKAEEPDLCLGCHVAVRGQFARPYRHPVSDRVLRCSDCHRMSDEDPSPLSFMGTNDVCTSCHTEMRGPFPFEHPATLDFSTEGGGCLNCHDPHGSFVPRLLRQPYEAPHQTLCSQCHIVPRHNLNVQHGTAWSGVACNECHVDVHGSYTSRLFLKPDLAAQGCFAVGCHQE